MKIVEKNMNLGNVNVIRRRKTNGKFIRRKKESS